MMKITNSLLVIFLFFSCNSQKDTKSNMINTNKYRVIKTEKEWKEKLSPEQFSILREAGTERPFTGKYNMHFEKGIYSCAACGEELFSSDSKFDAHCGWPSFDKEIAKGKIIEKLDKSHGMIRVEIQCSGCGSHLGHVFNDGPTKTGLRYCANSLSLDFKNDDD